MKLLEPITFGGHELKNRLALAPMTTYSSNDDLTPSNQEIDYIRHRSKELGLVISPAISINEQAQAFENQITLKADRFIEPMRPFVKAMQANGGKAIAQLHHGGRMNVPALYDDPSMIVSASPVRAPREGFVTPRAMTVPEIKQTIKDFASATRRAIEAGYDGIELHGANTYLLQQFFSPHTNKRTDAYGGSLENRYRFIKELIEAVHHVIATAKRPVIFGYRFSPEELEEDGITLEDTEFLIRQLNKTPLDYLHVSLGHFAQSSIRNDTSNEKLIDRFRALTKEKILIGSGGIHQRDDLIAAAEQGYDMMAIGVALLTDVDFVEKIRRNEEPSSVLPKDTLPEQLYQRLYKNKARFEKRGMKF